jgi:hypothetical protein
MATREKLNNGALPYLEPGEQIHAVFLAKRPSMEYNDRAVVATNRRLLLLKLNFFGRPIALLTEADRKTRLGPWTGSLLYRLPAFDGNLSVARRFRKDVDEADRKAGFEPGPQVAPGWYPRFAHSHTMLWWDGAKWLDPDQDMPPDDGKMLHSLRFVGVLVVMQACVAFVIGYFMIPFALRRTGRRARDILMLLIPVWGVVVCVQTFWRLSARRLYWSPCSDLASRPLFGPALLPIDRWPVEWPAPRDFTGISAS